MTTSQIKKKAHALNQYEQLALRTLAGSRGAKALLPPLALQNYCEDLRKPGFVTVKRSRKHLQDGLEFRKAFQLTEEGKIIAQFLASEYDRLSQELYVGVVERNPWEKETFGYYWPYSETGEAHLKALLDRYTAAGESRLRLDTPNGYDLYQMERRDHNSYMRRVNYYPKPRSWPAYVKRIAPPKTEIHDSDPFWKGRGLGERL